MENLEFSNKKFAQEVVNRLNYLLGNESVRSDVLKLMRHKIRCSPEVAEHPNITVSSAEILGKSVDFLGPLGLLNGLVDTTDFRIVMVVDSSDTKLLRFELLDKTL